MKFLAVVLLFISSIAYGNSGNLSLRQVQFTYAALIEFHQRVDSSRLSAKQKSVFSFSLLNNAYASGGNICLFGGWPSQILDGKCKAPWIYGQSSRYKGVDSSYKSCGGDNLFRCNPLLFGGASEGGKCINTGGTFTGLTRKCLEQTRENKEEAIRFLQENQDVLAQLKNDANLFCEQSANGLGAKEDYIATCTALKERLAEIDSTTSTPRSIQAENAPPPKENVNKALGLLTTCQKKYEEKGGLTKSKRNILGGVVEAGINVNCNEVIGLPTDEEIESFEEGVTQVTDSVFSKKVLQETTKDDLELTFKAMLLNKVEAGEKIDFDEVRKSLIEAARRGGGISPLGKRPYKDIIDSSLDDVKKAIKLGKVSKPSSTKGINAYSALANNINTLCGEINSEYQSFFTNGRRGKRLKNSMKGKLGEFFEEKQDSLYGKLTQFKNKNKSGKLIESPYFKEKIFPDIGNFAEQCARNKPEPAFFKPKAKDLDEGYKSISNLLEKDLDKIGKRAAASFSGSESQVDDSVKDIFKYKPYLLGQFFKEQKRKDQRGYAEYFCKKTREIYSRDEKFKFAEYAVAGLGLGASAVLAFTGIGSPLAATIAAGSVTLIEGGIAAGNYQDGNKIIRGADSGLILDQVDDKSYRSRVEAASEQKSDAKIAVAAAAAGGLGGLVRVGRVADDVVKASDEVAEVGSESTKVTAAGVTAREVAESSDETAVVAREAVEAGEDIAKSADKASDSFRPGIRKENVYNDDYVPPSNIDEVRDEYADFAEDITNVGPNAPDKYLSKGYWAQHVGSYGKINELPLQGWKFHVSAKPETMLKIGKDLLPELQKRGIPHKVVSNFDGYLARAGKEGKSQQGKFITVYPRNEEEAVEYGKMLKKIMSEKGYTRDDFLNIPNEMELAPGLYGRYGRLVGGDLKDANGNVIRGSENMILDPNGNAVPDPRGDVLPSFIKPLEL